MSYSFQFRAATKEEAKAKAVEEMGRVVAQQPVHSQDREAALAAFNAFVDMLQDDPTRDIQASCHGSVSYEWRQGMDETTAPLTSASVGVSAYLIAKE